MAYGNPKILEGTHLADADYTAKQFHCVRLSASGVILSGAGGEVDGILQNKPNIGEQCEIGRNVVKAKAGGVFNRGADLMSNVDGKLVTATATNKIVAKAMESAVADDVIAVIFQKNGKK